MLIRPPRAWIDLRTTSMPTPRPETSETVSAVEKPGRKIRLSISSSVSTSSSAIRPRDTAMPRTRSRLMPRPSSLISMTIRPARCSATRRTVPSAGLPASRRSSGVFEAVVDGVAQHVGDRFGQPFDHGLVDLGGLALGDQPNVLAVSPRPLRARSAVCAGTPTPSAARGWPSRFLDLAGQQLQILEAHRNAGRPGKSALDHPLGQHGLLNDQFADDVDQAVDPVQIDPDGDRGRRGGGWGCSLDRRSGRRGRGRRSDRGRGRGFDFREWGASSSRPGHAPGALRGRSRPRRGLRRSRPQPASR